MFEDLRRRLIIAYKTAHDIQYPALAVNYPNIMSYDPETESAPFVVVTYELIPKKLGLEVGSYKVRGTLSVTYFFRPNTGTAHSTTFSDFLTSNFGLKTVDGFEFEEVRPYSNAGMAGWKGTLNVIPFTIQYFNIG